MLGFQRHDWWGKRLKERSSVVVLWILIFFLSYSISFQRCHCPYQWVVQWGGCPSATTWCELQWIRVHFAQLYTQHHAPVPLWKVSGCWCSMPRFVCECAYRRMLLWVCLYVWDTWNVLLLLVCIELVCIVLQLFPLPMETVVMVIWGWWEAVTTCSRVQEMAEWRSASTMPGEQFVALHLVFQMPRWPVMNLEDSIERVKLSIFCWAP